MWDCGMTPTAGCKHVFSSPWYSIYSVDRASDLVWENLLLVPQRDKIHQHHYWSYLYTIGFACKYASYCATSKILFGWLQFRWDYKHHHIISRVVLGFSSFTVLSLGSITSLTLLSRALHVALASFARILPSLWMFFEKYLHIFLHWGSQCEGAWWVPLKWLTWLLSWVASSSLQVYKAVPSPWV